MSGSPSSLFTSGQQRPDPRLHAQIVRETDAVTGGVVDSGAPSAKDSLASIHLDMFRRNVDAITEVLGS